LGFPQRGVDVGQRIPCFERLGEPPPAVLVPPARPAVRPDEADERPLRERGQGEAQAVATAVLRTFEVGREALLPLASPLLALAREDLEDLALRALDGGVLRGLLQLVRETARPLLLRRKRRLGTGHARAQLADVTR